MREGTERTNSGLGLEEQSKQDLRVELVIIGKGVILLLADRFGGALSFDVGGGEGGFATRPNRRGGGSCGEELFL